MDDFDWDFSDDAIARRDRDLRFDAGCFLAVVAMVFVIAALLWIVRHRRQVEIVMFFAFLAGGGWLARGYVTPLFRRRKPDLSPPPTPLADLKPGAVHTTGLVGVSAPALHAPLGAPPCAFFRIVVDSPSHPGHVLFEARSADELVLDDGGGNKLVVHLDGVKWLVHRFHEMSSADEHVVAYLAERGLRFDQPVRVRVMWIAPHELVFVRGVAREASQALEAGYRTSEAKAPPLEIASTPERPVLIALESIPLKRRRPSATSAAR
jgi:hypothetical protein